MIKYILGIQAGAACAGYSAVVACYGCWWHPLALLAFGGIASAILSVVGAVKHFDLVCERRASVQNGRLTTEEADVIAQLRERYK